MSDQKFGMEFETKKDAGLMASKTGKYDKSELYEIFNGDTPRSEKLEVLEDIAGDSQAVIAPTRGYPYQPELNSDDTIRDVYFNEIEDVKMGTVPKGEIDEGGDYWVMVSDDNVVIHYREVDKEAWEFIDNKRNQVQFISPPSASDLPYSVEFDDGLTISGNRDHYIVVPEPEDLESKDYFSVKFEYMEKMVRLGRGGSYSKRWYQGKTLSHDGDKARIDTENGFYVIAGAKISGYTDEHVDLAGAVKLNETGSMRGGQTGLTIVPTDTYPDYESLLDAIESSDIGMKKFEVISELKDNGISVKRNLDEDLGEEELEKILELDPEPKVVNDDLIRSLKKDYYVPEMNNYIAYKDFDEFTGSDLEVHDIDAGDVVEIPVADADAITGSINSKLKPLDDFFDILREYPSEKLSEKSWSVETNSGEVTFQFTKDVDSVRPYPIFVGGDIPEKIATETNYPLTDIKRRDEEGALYVRPRSVKDVVEEIERFDDNESELSDSGSGVNAIYDEYNEMVNMTPADIDDRMDNMDCVHKASGDDAVEHLKRNKFIQETNKSDWSSKKVPEEYANDSAESRKVVDQAVRTVSFGERHLAQLENESITRMEDGCYNARVEGLRNWAIDPLQMNGFSVDEDNYSDSEMSDSSVKYESSGSGGQSRLNDSAVESSRVPDVDSSSRPGVEMFESEFGNVETEVYVDHDSSKKIENGTDAKEHLRDLDIANKPNERFVAVYLNGNNEVLGTQVVAMGDGDSVSFDHKSIIRTASMVNAPAVIVAHNHPSGNESASDDDLRAIRDLKNDLRDVNVELLDSLVIGGDSTIDISSMRDNTSIW